MSGETDDTPRGAPAGQRPGAAATAVSRSLLPANIRNLRSGGDDSRIDASAKVLAHRHGVTEEVEPPPPPPPPRRARPKSPIAPDLEMPYDGEPVSWRGNLRADFPEYALEQLNEFCHRHRCTQVSALLQMMAAFTSPDGKPFFYIRREDMVADRRKAGKKRT